MSTDDTVIETVATVDALSMGDPRLTIRVVRTAPRNERAERGAEYRYTVEWDGTEWFHGGRVDGDDICGPIGHVYGMDDALELLCMPYVVASFAGSEWERVSYGGAQPESESYRELLTHHGERLSLWSTQEWQVRTEYALRRAGEEDGRNSVEWWAQETIGGRARGDAAYATARRTIDGIEDGDPGTLDALPHLDLSGQWADGPTERRVFAAHVWGDGAPSADECDPELLSSLVDSYRDAYDAAVVDRIAELCQGVIDANSVTCGTCGHVYGPNTPAGRCPEESSHAETEES